MASQPRLLASASVTYSKRIASNHKSSQGDSALRSRECSWESQPGRPSGLSSNVCVQFLCVFYALLPLVSPIVHLSSCALLFIGLRLLASSCLHLSFRHSHFYAPYIPSSPTIHHELNLPASIQFGTVPFHDVLRYVSYWTAKPCDSSFALCLLLGISLYDTTREGMQDHWHVLFSNPSGCVMLLAMCEHLTHSGCTADAMSSEPVRGILYSSFCGLRLSRIMWEGWLSSNKCDAHRRFVSLNGACNLQSLLRIVFCVQLGGLVVYEVWNEFSTTSQQGHQTAAACQTSASIMARTAALQSCLA